jgi:ribosomal protein L11 methyltransferase
VVDLGTGTGVLALAAALLGAKRVLAVDLNPLCVKTAKRNVALNELQGRIVVVEGQIDRFLGEPADIVVANMHPEAVTKILDARDFGKGERFIVSGLMRSQWQDIKGRLNNLCFRILREWDHEMTWFTILAVKNHALSHVISR